MKTSKFAILVLAALGAPTERAAAADESLRWTIEDIVTVPEVTELAISGDGRAALYAVRAADIGADKSRWTLRLVDLQQGIQRDLLVAEQASYLKRIPRSDAWSAILDIGDGMQLYRIERSGDVSPIIRHLPTVLAGKADMALPGGASGAPQHIGILAYDWSPDGQRLWYSLLKPADRGARVRFDEQVVAERSWRRSRIDAAIEIRIRTANGSDTLVTTRPASDRAARFFGGNVLWVGDEVHFRTEEEDGTEDGRFETRVWNLGNKALRTLAAEDTGQTIWVLKGPRGGQLVSKGVGDRFELAEGFENRPDHVYGHFPFLVGDPRSIGIHASADGRKVLVGTRSTGIARYGLVLIERNRVTEIGGSGSYTKCDFLPDLAAGICVREGISTAPELVQIDVGENRVTRVASVSARHAAIAPLEVRPRRWVNRLGYEATGYVVLPRGYIVGQRYPAIIVTHGSDADERFANSGFQWDFPVQMFAERGYVVLLMNDPRSRQDRTLWSAYQAWMRGGGPPGPEEVQRLIWLNGVYSFEDAIKEMAAQGLVDPDRVGIAGFSRGSQMVNVALTQSHMFRAASGGDGSFLEPSGYSISPQSYKAIFGGSPFGDHIEQYRRFSPSLNGDKACGALLQQLAQPHGGAIDLHQAMRAHHVPSQLTLYPGETAVSDETHIFHIPSNRLRAQRENLAWFDYWLLSKPNPEMPFPERLAMWDAMADEAGRPVCAQ